MRIRPLDRKLLRDLWRIRGQALAVAAVMGAGVGIFVLSASTFTSLELTRRTYYERYRFADVFASCKRAPLALEEAIDAIPGVAEADVRVVADVLLDVRGMAEPAAARLISLPETRRPVLCDVFLRAGRYPEPGRPEEVLASETFALAHGLGPGDLVTALLNGRRRALHIVGLALSPEYVYPIRPGEMIPDEKRFGVFWIQRRAVAGAFDMEGAFNDVVLRLSRGASAPEVLARLDRLLEPYGGRGSIPRALQTSHWYLESELTQLRNMGAVIPALFLAVAAFLLHVVFARIVLVQREQIAALKALGYGNRDVALHYIQWSLVVGLAGAAFGIALGAWLGAAMTRLYTLFFHFPLLLYTLDARTLLSGIAISLAAAILGAVHAVRQAVALPPAEAMRPPAPASFSVGGLERTLLSRWLSPPARIVWRNLRRHPGRALLSVVGIALGGALLVVSNFSLDAVDELMDVQFHVAQRYDVMVSLTEPASAAGRFALERLPGVLDSETYRAVPVRLRSGHRSRTLALLGVEPEARLSRVIDASLRAVSPPPDGLVLSAKLAQILAVRPGETVAVEVLEGQRPVRSVFVAALVDDYLGVNAYMDRDALHRLMGEGRTVSGAYLRVSRDALDALYRTLKNTPKVAGVLLKRAAIDSFNETMASLVGQVRAIYVLFACIIAFGVVYNNTRIALAERRRELATLRVIGFTRGEISSILLGEIAVLTCLAVPLGLLLGYGLAAAIVEAFALEVWRMPLVVFPRTYAFAAITILAATAFSAAAVRRRLDRLDLVGVLKTRE